MGKKQDSGTSNEAAQNSETSPETNQSDENKIQEQFDNFLKEVPKKCKDAGFTKEQTEEFMAFAKELEPGIESVQKVVTEFGKIATQIPDSKTGAEGEIPKLIASEDFQKFLKVQEVTGEIEEGLDISKLSDQEQRAIIADYHGWVNAGRPKPQLSKEAKGKIEKINSLSKVKYLGNLFLTYICDGDVKSRGLEKIITYGKGKHPDGSTFTDKNRIESEVPHYTIPYTEKKAKELWERCKVECVKPAMSIKMDERTFTVHDEENFFADFDVVIKKAMKGELI